MGSLKLVPPNHPDLLLWDGHKNTQCTGSGKGYGGGCGKSSGRDGTASGIGAGVGMGHAWGILCGGLGDCPTSNNGIRVGLKTEGDACGGGYGGGRG